MPDALNPLAAALEHYVQTLRAAWTHPRFPAPSHYLNTKTTIVVTKGTEEAARLPLTGRLVRGTVGVSVGLAARDRGLSPLSLALQSESEWGVSPPPTEQEERLVRAVASAHKDLCRAVRDVPPLHVQILLAGGYKTHTGDEARAQATDEATADHGWDVQMRLALGKHLDRAFLACGFDPDSPSAFDRWDDVAPGALDSLAALLTRTHWSYDVVALLNAPPVDDDAPLHLIDTLVDGQPVAITIEAATDELLSRFVDGPYNFAGDIAATYTSPVNSALRVRLSLPVEDSEASYIEVLSRAADLLVRTVDVLRIAASGDVGIVGVEPVPVHPDAPGIRWFNAGYTPTFAGILPRRTFFYTGSTAPISDAQLATLRDILPAYLDRTHGVQGLDVAMRRYRDSRERHRPGDPESLLDLTAAFEALVLNDGVARELSYRLSTRVARLFGSCFEDRYIAFDLLRTMYGIRSKLAHGATLDSMKPKAAQQVQYAMDYGPGVFELIIRHFLRGEGPSHLKGQKLSEWWCRVELSDESPFLPDP